ncbi:NBS-LRR type disease resistance protein [Melia azedarach]|uniref:NBS-LRR type disease resistance protein n=1 Tax=Melia azedarach TaxID=155640 RepID=A0ACC1YDY4_MELAZ|nr:NBS-LRR type disease resistance protein [Melia azedarach]
MHDVIRDMTLWIASTTEHEKENFLVLAGVGLTEAPSIEIWKDVTRMSLMNNKIQNLSESPICPSLRTLFLSDVGVDVVESDFLQSMTSLRVLDVSFNYNLHLAFQFSDLVSLQLLDLSSYYIKRLPEELKYLVNLRCLKLEKTFSLRRIPPKVISNLKVLQVLRMSGCGGLVSQEEDSILFGDGELLVKELLCLKHLNVLTITLKSLLAFQKFMSSPTLQSSTQSLCLENLKGFKVT